MKWSKYRHIAAATAKIKSHLLFIELLVVLNWFLTPHLLISVADEAAGAGVPGASAKRGGLWVN